MYIDQVAITLNYKLPKCLFIKREERESEENQEENLAWIFESILAGRGCSVAKNSTLTKYSSASAGLNQCLFIRWSESLRERREVVRKGLGLLFPDAHTASFSKMVKSESKSASKCQRYFYQNIFSYASSTLLHPSVGG